MTGADLLQKMKEQRFREMPGSASMVEQVRLLLGGDEEVRALAGFRWRTTDATGDLSRVGLSVITDEALCVAEIAVPASASLHVSGIAGFRLPFLGVERVAAEASPGALEDADASDYPRVVTVRLEHSLEGVESPLEFGGAAWADRAPYLREDSNQGLFLRELAVRAASCGGSVFTSPGD
jgi:hypothetical protein